MANTRSGKMTRAQRWRCLSILLVFVVGSLVLYYNKEISWISNPIMKTPRLPQFVNRWNHDSSSNTQFNKSVFKQPELTSIPQYSILIKQSNKTSTLQSINDIPVNLSIDSNSNFTTSKLIESFSYQVYMEKLTFCLAGKQFSVGDKLQIDFCAKDELNNTVTNIGDFYRASILSKESKSGAVGIITDHLNGTYTATFRLLWEGEVTIRIQLVLPRQAIDIIERISSENPVDLITFQRRYTIGGQSINKPCNVDPVIFKNTSAVCNYSDPHAGGWWYCEKPANIPCNTPGYHALRSYGHNLLKQEEENLFGSGNSALKMTISGTPAGIMVKKGRDYLVNRSTCTPELTTPQISGYYHQGVWNSLVCKSRHFSQISEWRQCLKGKNLHFFGDSTIRQWWEHLVRIMNLKETQIPEATHWTGPLFASDSVYNITVSYRSHGPPVRGPWTRTSFIKYVANAIDEIKGGPNDVVGITMWAHFTSYPVEVYMKRMEAVRAAVERLFRRSPETLVVIKSANTREGDTIIAGDWHAYKLDLVMREVFRGLNVVLVDAWEMTNAQHWHKDVIHPAEDIVTQELEYFCSFVCPM
ncbi:NXPE family member 3-like isoform X2 [Branchiostoma floridae x Branchiostoma belcheri]